MITISRETDYAARVVLHLSSGGDGLRVTAQQIAAERLIPRALVRRVVTRLAAAGIIQTIRGSEGGIELARPASDITLLQVVEAMEGSIALNRCAIEEGRCPLSPVCSVHDVWIDASDIIRHHLDQITFEQLAGKKENCSWTH